jgi:hypothetical protein
MPKKMTDFSKKDIVEITRDNINEAFVRIEPTRVYNGKEIRECDTYVPKALTEFAEMFDYGPVVEVAEGKFVPIDKIKQHF